jgi:hypothetical protein
LTCAILNAVILGIVISCVLMAIVLRVALKRDRMVFSNRHLVDAAIGIAQVRRAALENIEAADKARTMRADDPRSWVTPRKVVLVHRIARDGNKFVHTCSVSLAGGKTPQAVGSVFMALFVHLFGLATKGLEVHVTPKGRYHLGFTLNEEQQRNFENKKLELPSMDAAAGLRTKLVVLAKQMRFKNVFPRS